MSYVNQEAARIKSICFSNETQIELTVNIKNYINKNYSEKLNLDVLAETHYTSKYHLTRVFNTYYGTTPGQYLTNKRIEMAKKSLKSGKSVSETCYAVGFESVNSFSRLFKSKTGLSPSAFKRATFDKSV